MPSQNMSPGDVISGGLLSLLSIYIISMSLSWTIVSDAGPGPGFFPLLYSLVMLPVALLLLLRGMRRPAPLSPVADDDDVEEKGSGVPMALATWLALAISVPLMSAFGFLCGFLALCLFMTKVVFGRPLLGSAVASVCITVGIYVVFQLLLEIDLPAGIFGGR
ncbi:tripartite tricarboxylate transporter TctB family protein [Neorhizobium alkalisoli]|uniref:Tripartite tricarboxylate transporter TctB family protein n=1 Tax=Neorhizobium alkalisoli TaxID=528178 RepID=A0A561QAT1_9HYPH|nr:tripartite tricarboxylate transporter TctB family protein [Neorhizobium alkalisoli]TWF47473.1 tripartite tricarboxylate transporter TctB family protein [Neorhizobium alkalisoli]